MKDVKDYAEYKELFKDDLVVIVRKILQKIEDNAGFDLEDSPLHNELVRYFNKFGLHKKLTKKEMENWKY